MAKTDDGWKPTTIYRLAYRKSSGGGGGHGERSSRRRQSEAAERFDRLMAKRNAVESSLPTEIVIPLLADAALTTYARDYLPPYRVAAVAKWSSSRPEPTGGGGGPATGATACERATAVPRANVTYTGPAPPEPYVAPRTEYWWSHGQLAGRVIAEQLPKRTKRCQRINPTRIF